MQRRPLKRSELGFSLIEMSVSLGVSSVIVLAALSYTSSISLWKNSSTASLTAYEMLVKVSRSIRSDTAWLNTLESNPGMACLAQRSDCSASAGGSFRLLDETNQVVFDPSLGAGTSLSGFGDSGLCTTYNPTDGNSRCPFRYEMTWTPLCPPGGGACINPSVSITARFMSKVPGTQQLNLNPENYSITVVRSAVIPKPPLIGANVLYTNRDESVSSTLTDAVIIASTPSTTYTVTAVSQGANGTVSIDAGGLVTYAPNAGFYGLDTFSYTLTASTGGSNTAMAWVKVMTPHTWTGNAGSNSNWSDGLNWCGRVVDGACIGGVEPDYSSTVVFDATCAVNCSSYIDHPFGLHDLKMKSGYVGTVTQGPGNNMQLGLWPQDSAYSWIQESGTFVGSDADIVFLGDLIVSGGSFRATSALSLIFGSFQLLNTPAFDANNGSLEFAWMGTKTLDGGPAILNNVKFTLRQAETTIGLLNIAGNFRIENDAWRCNVFYGGIINAMADVHLETGGFSCDVSTVLQIVGSGTQNISGTGWGAFPETKFASTGTINLSGTVAMGQSFTYVSGTVVAGTSLFHYGAGGTSTLTPGPIEFYDFRFARGGSDTTLDGTLNVNHALFFNDDPWRCAVLLGGTINARGNITMEGGGPSCTVTTLLKVNGAGTQTITGSAWGAFPTMRVESTGSVNLVDTVVQGGEFTYVSGTVDAGTSTFIYAAFADTNLTTGPIAFHNFTFRQSSHTTTLNGPLEVRGTLEINNDPWRCMFLVGDSINARGDVTMVGGGFSCDAIAPIIKINGSSGPQTITGNGYGRFPGLEFNSANVNLVGAIVMGGGLKHVSGTVAAGTSLVYYVAYGPSTLDVAPIAFNDFTFAQSQSPTAVVGTLNVDGTLTFDDDPIRCNEMSGGAIKAGGNLSILTAPGCSFTNTMEIVGAKNQILIINPGQGYPGNVVTINKTAGTLSLGSDISFSAAGQSVNLVAGTMNLASYNLTINNALSLNGNTLNKNGRVLTVGGVVAGDGPLFGGTVNP